MGSHLKSMLWLRWQYLLGNKIILFVCGLTPLVDVYLLALLSSVAGGPDVGLLFLGLGIVYSVSAGMFVAMILGDEKEKRNLRTLILSGVSDFDYVFSLIVIPIVLTVVYALGLPLLYGIIVANWLTYLVVVILTSLIYILINMTIGFFAKNQMQSMAVSMLVFIFSIFIPMMSQNSEILKNVTDFSFLGANTAYFNDTLAYSLMDKTMIALLMWNVVFGFGLIWAYRFNLKNR